MIECWNLFVAFFRASHLTFGGGPAMIPLIQTEVVNKYKWVSEEEFNDMVAVATALSAPMVTKLAAMIGYRAGGWLGVLAAEIGVFLPTTLAVVLLGGLIRRFADSTILQAMLAGVRPVVIVLLLQVAWNMGKKAFVDRLMWAFGAVSLGLVLFMPWIHPAFLVAGSMALGYLLYRNK
ncbi:MAG: chromate transporter [Peptococcaceae bacterium]|nr:chromate transporter [Peptococcaceae bacterium]